MVMPATTGQLRTKISDMEIGDYIVCKSTNGILNWILGDDSGTEIPTAGNTWSVGLTNYFWYMVKIAEGLIISDRVLLHTVSWDTLNNGKNIQGRIFTFNNNITGTIRSLTGGVAYADQNGNKGVYEGNIGGWPTNNEWDKYIVNFPQELIQEGKTLDDIFHWSNAYSWTQDTPDKQFTVSTRRVKRGKESIYRWHGITESNVSSLDTGFRPVFEYKEGDN